MPTAPDDPEADYDRFVRANLRRNYAAHYIHGMLGMTGFRLVNAPTFIPAYLHLLSGSNLIVGLGLALQQFGAVVSPIVGASAIEHRRRMMPVAVLLGTLMRLPVLGLALAGWWLAGTPLLVAILVLLFLFGLFGGPQRVVFQTMLAKVIPIDRRGRLQAWRNLTGGLIAAGLAWYAGRVFIERNLLGNGYSTTFLLAFVLTSFGLLALRLLMREPEPPTVRAQTRLGERLREFPALFRADPDFAWFLGAQTLGNAARIASPFYVLHASAILGLDGATLGLLSLAFLGADTLSNLVWGYVGDRTGFRAIFIASLVLWIGATLLLLGADDRLTIALAFAGLGAASCGYMMSVNTIVLEFGVRDDIAMRLAIVSTAEGAMAALGPLIGGVLAATLGYPALFVVSIAIQALALILAVLRVREPRRR